MLIARIPGILSKTFKSLTWEIPSSEKVVYLTFDDGPTPGVTEWTLDQLKRYESKATFFCLGNNVRQHPSIYEKILKDGHAVGNHSYSHIKGFRKSVSSYAGDVDEAAKYIRSNLFRPPYGRILPGQVRKLGSKYKIIMWTVLSVDYNGKLSGDTVVRNVTAHAGPGSIVVFHDSVKASKNLYYALPRVLDYFAENGFRMEAVPAVGME